MPFWESVSASALSLVVSGNTGVSPFLSLFIVGICGNADPTLLNMNESIQTILASWPALIILGVLTVLEFVAKCVPVIDEIVDSVLIFVVPLVSILGSLSTFGILTAVSNGYENLNIGDTGDRSLQYDAASSSSASSGGGFFLMLLQVMLVVVGIGLSVLIHLFKMLIRLLGEGCLTNCLTILETLWIISTIILAIYIRPIAIGVACILACAGAFSFKRRVLDKLGKQEEEQEAQQHSKDPSLPMATLDTKEKSTTTTTDWYVAMKDKMPKTNWWQGK